MRKNNSHLSAADWFIVAASVLLILALQAERLPYIGKLNSSERGASEGHGGPQEHAQENTYAPRIFDARRQIIRQTNERLPVRAERSYRTRFLIGTYYGSFAYGANGSWGFALGYASLPAAREEALAQCANASGGSACKVFADMLPVSDGASTTGQGESLSFAQAEAFRMVRSGRGARAFARSDDGSWGVATGKTIEAASQSAVAECRNMQPPEGRQLDVVCTAVAVWTD